MFTNNNNNNNTIIFLQPINPEQLEFWTQQIKTQLKQGSTHLLVIVVQQVESNCI